MYLMQTLLIWLILVESAIKMEILQLTKMFDKRHIYVETYNVIPSCIILSLFYHLLKIYILAVYQFSWLFKIATSS